MDYAESMLEITFQILVGQKKDARIARSQLAEKRRADIEISNRAPSLEWRLHHALSCGGLLCLAIVLWLVMIAFLAV
jgi:hypothetical protein